MILPNQKRGQNAITMIWIVTVFNILETIFSSIDLIYTQDSGTLNSRFYIHSFIIGIISLSISIVSALTFIQWFRRAYWNLHQKIGSLSYTEGWAAGGWFVPILNLYVPYKIMVELYEKTDNVLRLNNIDSSLRSKTSLVIWWWALWIIIGAISLISLRIYLQEDESVINVWLDVVVCIIYIPLAVVTEKMIKEYSKAEIILYEMDNNESEFKQNE